MLKSVYNALHASRERRSGIGNAVAHRVAATYLDRNARLVHKLFERGSERHHEAVIIRSRDILEMATGTHAYLERLFDDAQIFVHRLTAGKVHLLENMVVGATYENARFLESHFFDEAEILLGSAYPARHFGEFEPELNTFSDGFLVLIGINEEFALTDKPFGSAEPAHHLIKIHYLFHRERLLRLLSVAESGVRYPDVFRAFHRHVHEVEQRFRHGLVVEHLPEKMRLVNVLKVVREVVRFQKVYVVVVENSVFHRCMLLRIFIFNPKFC